VILLLCAMIAVGYALTVYVFYPGIMTYDAMYVHGAIAEGWVGDWQSPVMTWLWSLVDPLAPGAGSMFLLIASVYWAGFAVLALTLRRSRLALLVPLLGLLPPAFILVGVIWRDILFAAAWLLAAALTLAAADRHARLRVLLPAAALALVGLGVLLRPNAILAAPLLAAYAVWPRRFDWKRAALAYVPGVIAGYALINVVYYGAFHAVRQNPLHSVFVFDLGGITHFAKRNVFPVTWTADETAKLTSTCYDPTMWDVYWNRGCQFVMRRIENQEKLFGTPALAAAWRDAILAEPVAFLLHRTIFFWTFLAGDRNVVVWFQDLADPDKVVFPDNAALQRVKAVHDALKPTPLFRPGLWLLLCAGVCALAWRRRATPEGAFALAACGSAVAYLTTFWAVGVASDFRYGYWAVLAGLAGAVVVAVARATTRLHDGHAPSPRRGEGRGEGEGDSR
jgi:hypothetical protein